MKLQQQQGQQQQPQQSYQEPRGYTGLKTGFWIALAMLIHFIAMFIGQFVVMMLFMLQDIASGALTFTLTGEIFYLGEPVITSVTTSAMSEAYMNRYVYETSSYGNILAMPLVILGLWLCNLVQKTKLKESVPYRKFPVVPNLLAFVVGFSVCVPASFIVTYTFLNDLSPQTTETMNLMFANTPMWALILSTVIAAPIMEECTFRGFIYTKLKTAIEPWMGKRGYIFTIVLQGLLFGAFHMNLQQFVYASALGMLLGWMRYYTKSIWPGIFAHVGFNFFSVALYGILQHQDQWGFAKRIAEMSDLTMLLIALPIFAVSLFLFEMVVKKQGKPQAKTSQNQ